MGELATSLLNVGSMLPINSVKAVDGGCRLLRGNV
jgi:hypothetical protein